MYSARFTHDEPGGLVPPQLPRVDEVDKEIALKYLDAYQAYISAHIQISKIQDKKEQEAVLDSNAHSIAPSMSASQTGHVAPVTVRIDSRESMTSYTPPEPSSEYTGLVLDDKINGSGFCYLALVKPEHRSEIQNQLGKYPSFQKILSLRRDIFLPDDKLVLLQIARTAPGYYHVLTGTIMPNVVSTLAAVVDRDGTFTNDDDTLYNWAATVVPRADLSIRAPLMSDILGSGYRSYDRRHNDTNSYYPSTMYTTSTSYDPYPNEDFLNYVDYNYSPRYPYIPYTEYRRPYSNDLTSNRGSLFRSDIRHQQPNNITAIEPRRRSRSRRRRHRREHDRAHTNVEAYSRYNEDDDEYDRVLRASAAEYRSDHSESQNNAYRTDTLLQQLDEIEQSLVVMREGAPDNHRTSENSHISSTASTSSVKVHGSLQGIECGICKDVIAEGAGFLQCGHVFHSECVDIWLNQNNTCPTCRARF